MPRKPLPTGRHMPCYNSNRAGGIAGRAARSSAANGSGWSAGSGGGRVER